MTADRRKRDRDIREISIAPSGALVDEANVRAWLAGMVTPRTTVVRLSKLDPVIAAFEATARGSRAA